ncbi:helix-turn-helix transcriptional regulator [Devosia sp. BK]|uniref:helix-turn-helix transcriptional regulator n=1 Tax=Devosia sp. BK TaxID=2871706 RepID=UPI00293A119A|nr:helix-turn-helix transcriptional regulator [Devosia sp. BK]MDV3251070.1 helix-turn-helix transcriptional regulator [Devosia sp. BK]
MSVSPSSSNALGDYLRDRRTRLDPATFGYTGTRRRTAGLRREEVAQRSNISPTWYTWLEQGRGGAPSADVLDRLSKGLMLTEMEREHIYILALGRPPEVQYKPIDGVTPRLQKILDAMAHSPAFIKSATWDVLAWNRAAAAVLTDYGKLPVEKRNILRLMFGQSSLRAIQEDWESVARYVVGSFRADVARAGATEAIKQLVDELSASSPDFKRLWIANDIAAHHEGVKRLHHPDMGLLQLEFSAFAVDGRPELGMVVYNPVSSEDTEKVQALMERSRVAASADRSAS